MRKKCYLSKPERMKDAMLSLENSELNPNLTRIVDIAKEQKQEDVINVIRHNDFNHGYTSTSKFTVLKEETEDKLGINYETQLNILIASEDNPEVRENMREYCSTSRNHPEFDEEKLVEDILSGKFTFL